MIKIVLGDWFSLPRMSRETFLKLMRVARLKYDSKRGFRVEKNTDLFAVASILKAAVGEDVEFALTCFVCGKPVECESCIYRNACDRRMVSQNCICDEDRGREEAYTIYVTHLASVMKD